ncbi:hypothetical protein RGAI101_3890 [Roseobacter sp. GAI101]|nr:hypothetical protein RGAI101_3890 [Roseobacter sp. GAI101]
MAPVTGFHGPSSFGATIFDRAFLSRVCMALFCAVMMP